MSLVPSRLPQYRNDEAVEAAIKRAEDAAYARGFDDGGKRARVLILQARKEAIAEAGDAAAAAVLGAVRKLKSELVL